MSDRNPIPRARQGDPDALAHLPDWIAAQLDSQLRAKGVATRAYLRKGCLTISLEGANAPKLESLAPCLQERVLKMRVAAIRKLAIDARVQGASQSSWQRSFVLEYPSAPEDRSETSNAREAEPVRPVEAAPIPAPTIPVEKTFPFLVSLTLSDLLEGAKAIAFDPLEGLPEFFERLDRRRALLVGLIFCGSYILSATSSTASISRGLAFFGASAGVKAGTMFALLQCLGTIGGSALVWRLLRGKSSFVADVFIVGCSSLPITLSIWISHILRPFMSVQIALFAFLLCIAYAIIVLYSGCNRIAKVPRSFAPLAVTLVTYGFFFSSYLAVRILFRF